MTRACKGVLAAGLTPSRAEIGADGKIVMVFGDTEQPPAETAFDQWKAAQSAKAGK